MKQPSVVRAIRFLSSHRLLIQTAIVSAVTAIALMFLCTAAWRAYSDASMYHVIFESTSGESLSVTTEDASGNRLAQFTVPASDVLLSDQEIQLDVVASQRLGYKRWIHPSRFKLNESTPPAIALEQPARHLWILDDVLWFTSLDLMRNSKPANHCIVLQTEGLVLIETSSGKVLWTHRDSDKIEWGQSVRGCPATFQPDRYVVIQDTDGNGSQEIVIAHPNRAELLCLDSADGKQLWRSDLLRSAGIQTTDASSVCPVILQEFISPENNRSSLSVVVAPHDPDLAETNRWFMNVEPSDGEVRWHLGSQLNTKTAVNWTTRLVERPLHLQWGEVEKRPLEFGEQRESHYFDDYWKRNPWTGVRLPFEINVRLGTERPFEVISENRNNWHWIDGPHWQVVDPETGKLLSSWKLPDDCVCPPKILRNHQGKTLVLTVHPSLSGYESDYVAWDAGTNQIVWKAAIESDLNRLPQSYLSRGQDFPVIVDLDDDGVDEWISPSAVAGVHWTHPLTPPYGSVMAHRGDNGAGIWEKPCYLPNLDGMIERAVAVSDMDGDSWKDLWLVDKSMKLVDHWTESTPANGSIALTNVLKNIANGGPPPTAVRTLDNEELLGIATNVESSLGIKLLALKGDREPNTIVKRTVPLPTAPTDVRMMDCDGDGKIDFVALSDTGVDCLSSTGGLIWHKPSVAGVGNVGVRVLVVEDRKYLSLPMVSAGHSTSIFLDARTGEEQSVWNGIPINKIMSDENSKHGSLITFGDADGANKLFAFRFGKPTAAEAKLSVDRDASDPRYVRLLPWVVNAKFILGSCDSVVGRYSWFRILKLVIGVFLVPGVVVWGCARWQFGIRHLLLIATVIAVALAIVLADKNAFPTDKHGNGYMGALAIACGATVWLGIVLLPFIELSQDRWRRILSISLYGISLVCIPVLNFQWYPSGAIRTTYVVQEFWHLFWLALFPTGVVLFLVQGLRIAGGILGLSRRR